MRAMLPLAHLPTFLVASLVIVAIPGPGVLFIVSRALAGGRRLGLASALGQEAGGFVLVIAVALGVGSLMQRSVVAFTVVKLLGAAYLVVLGVRALLARSGPDDARLREQSAGLLASVRDGFAVGVTNPKGAVFFAAVLPQFADRGTGHLPLQILALGAVFVAIALACDAAWCVLAAAVRTRLFGSAARLRALRRAGGLAMIGIGVRVAFTGRSD
jgi:threonine/homoserine/homoserine lactone efflux protein